jgi:hypothetical protein
MTPSAHDVLAVAHGGAFRERLVCRLLFENRYMIASVPKSGGAYAFGDVVELHERSDDIEVGAIAVRSSYSTFGLFIDLVSDDAAVEEVYQAIRTLEGYGCVVEFLSGDKAFFAAVAVPVQRYESAIALIAQKTAAQLWAGALIIDRREEQKAA